MANFKSDACFSFRRRFRGLLALASPRGTFSLVRMFLGILEMKMGDRAASVLHVPCTWHSLCAHRPTMKECGSLYQHTMRWATCCSTPRKRFIFPHLEFSRVSRKITNHSEKICRGLSLCLSRDSHLYGSWFLGCWYVVFRLLDGGTTVWEI